MQGPFKALQPDTAYSAARGLQNSVNLGCAVVHFQAGCTATYTAASGSPVLLLATVLFGAVHLLLQRVWATGLTLSTQSA